MIELYYPDKMEPELLNRISQLVDAGYLHYINTEDEGDYYDHYFCVNDGLNHIIRVDGNHYFELTIAEYDDQSAKSEVFVAGGYSPDYSRTLSDTSIVEIIEFEVADTFFDDVSHEDAKLFAFSLKENGKLGWRLPTDKECDNYFGYLSRDRGIETYYYWTADGFWSNYRYSNTVKPVIADTIAVRTEVLMVV